MREGLTFQEDEKSGICKGTKMGSRDGSAGFEARPVWLELSDKVRGLTTSVIIKP